jgi:hypothetical protein
LDHFKAIILEKAEHGIRMSGVPKGYVVRLTTTGVRNPTRNDALLKTLNLTCIEKKIKQMAGSRELSAIPFLSTAQ